MSKKRKEARRRIKELLIELEKLRGQFTRQARGEMPDYEFEIDMRKLGGLGRFFRLSEPYDTANTTSDTVEWLEMERSKWQKRLDAETSNLSQKSKFFLQYVNLTERVEALGGKLNVNYYDSDSAFGEQFQVKVTLPRKKKVGMKTHYMFFNEYDLAFTKAWLIEVEKAHEERRTFINANS